MNNNELCNDNNKADINNSITGYNFDDKNNADYDFTINISNKVDQSINYKKSKNYNTIHFLPFKTQIDNKSFQPFGTFFEPTIKIANYNEFNKYNNYNIDNNLILNKKPFVYNNVKEDDVLSSSFRGLRFLGKKINRNLQIVSINKLNKNNSDKRNQYNIIEVEDSQFFIKWQFDRNFNELLPEFNFNEILNRMSILK